LQESNPSEPERQLRHRQAAGNLLHPLRSQQSARTVTCREHHGQVDNHN
jgi:hypothetical protein